MPHFDAKLYILAKRDPALAAVSFLREIREDYEQRINEMKELFGNTAHPSPKEISTISVRLLQMFNQGREAIKGAVSELGKEVGEDITGTVSGAIIQAGNRISVRAVGLTRRRVVDQILQKDISLIGREYHQLSPNGFPKN